MGDRLKKLIWIILVILLLIITIHFAIALNSDKETIKKDKDKYIYCEGSNCTDYPIATKQYNYTIQCLKDGKACKYKDVYYLLKKEGQNCKQPLCELEHLKVIK